VLPARPYDSRPFRRGSSCFPSVQRPCPLPFLSSAISRDVRIHMMIKDRLLLFSCFAGLLPGFFLFFLQETPWSSGLDPFRLREMGSFWDRFFFFPRRRRYFLSLSPPRLIEMSSLSPGGGRGLCVGFGGLLVLFCIFFAFSFGSVLESIHASREPFSPRADDR